MMICIVCVIVVFLFIFVMNFGVVWVSFFVMFDLDSDEMILGFVVVGLLVILLEFLLIIFISFVVGLFVILLEFLLLILGFGGIWSFFV